MSEGEGGLADRGSREAILHRVRMAIFNAPVGNYDAIADAAIVALLQALADGTCDQERRHLYLGLCGWLRD